MSCWASAFAFSGPSFSSSCFSLSLWAVFFLCPQAAGSPSIRESDVELTAGAVAGDKDRAGTHETGPRTQSVRFANARERRGLESGVWGQARPTTTQHGHGQNPEMLEIPMRLAGGTERNGGVSKTEGRPERWLRSRTLARSMAGWVE
ncbi:hypothetical protein B0T22DRAFT_102505 [Podospora appendiculata]|uniref:Secreted protein n=1 Tax=Podospora appendiculata TaxID=314037 RepID=A0AAE1CI95_9PEZI|nr:hypothetical protein B0T22DRAFT_102505 [Podospora appendiculata]